MESIRSAERLKRVLSAACGCYMRVARSYKVGIVFFTLRRYAQ